MYVAHNFVALPMLAYSILHFCIKFSIELSKDEGDGN